MLTATNELDCVEIAAYSVTETEEGRIIRYLQRGPGEAVWRPVKLFRPDPEARVACVRCGASWPQRTMSAGVCVPCFHGGTD